MVIKVCVVGGGIIGFTSAIVLQEQVTDIEISVISEKFSPDTTGDIAAGVWEPMILGNAPPEKILKWATKTYNIYKKLWRSEACAEVGLAMLPIIEVLDCDRNTPPAFFRDVALGYTQLNETQLSELSKLHGINLTWGYQYVTFTCMCSKMLPYLMGKFIRNGGRIIQHKVTSLEKLANEGYDVIINCTGLGAREVMGDTAVTPIRGQIVKVEAPWQFHIIINDAIENYIIPNQDLVVLGGTHQEGNRAQEIDQKDKQHIWDGCKRMVPGMKHANEVKNLVGFRPGRSSVRLEQGEDIIRNGKVTKVIHNYGHGGNGVTLSWGCAYEVTEILKNILGLNETVLLHSKL